MHTALTHEFCKSKFLFVHITLTHFWDAGQVIQNKSVCLVIYVNAVLDLGLNPGPFALETSTLPLGYRGGGYI